MHSYPLFEYFDKELGLTLLESQLYEIIRIVEETHETMDYQKLYNHIAEEHGLNLFMHEIEQIVRIVLEMHNEKSENCTESIK